MPRPRHAQANGWATAPLLGSLFATPYAEFDFLSLNFEQFASFYPESFFFFLPWLCYNSAYMATFIIRCSSIYMPLHLYAMKCKVHFLLPQHYFTLILCLKE